MRMKSMLFMIFPQRLQLSQRVVFSFRSQHRVLDVRFRCCEQVVYSVSFLLQRSDKVGRCVLTSCELGVAKTQRLCTQFTLLVRFDFFGATLQTAWLARDIFILLNNWRRTFPRRQRNYRSPRENANGLFYSISIR